MNIKLCQFISINVCFFHTETNVDEAPGRTGVGRIDLRFIKANKSGNSVSEKKTLWKEFSKVSV